MAGAHKVLSAAFSFRNTAREAGLTAVTVFGGTQTNKYLLETTGCGVAALDFDADGWLDIFLVNGSVLEGFPRWQRADAVIFIGTSATAPLRT